jgi:chemotaxis protein MotB
MNGAHAMNNGGRTLKKARAGAPPWVMTFADLMSLLMCFFVLLLAFSEMDVLKFKQLAGSMKAAFGVQREVAVKEIPKGTSVIAREFSPGRPDETVVNEVRQKTMDDQKRQLEASRDPARVAEDSGERPAEQVKIIERVVQPSPDTTQITEALAAEIRQGLIDIETEQQRIIIRIQERGAFPSGSATMIPRFESVIARIGEVLKGTRGRLIIAGHTDDRPISTARFRSNWELSSARSVTVVHQLGKVTDIDGSRFLVEGHADTKPLAPNDTPENRARNRRVEIVIVQGQDIDAGEFDVGPEVITSGG